VSHGKRLQSVLVLEDDLMVMSMFRAILQKAGFFVLSAQSAEVVLCWTSDPMLHIDLLVADMHPRDQEPT
jgi:DNA-binding response OmpR family regulator